jgi:membrane protease YdiL (CAAX protease family)
MSGSIRRLVVRHPVAAFLVMVYAVNIAVALPSILTRRDLLPFGFAPYDLLGHIVGSALPAFLVVAAVHGRDGVRNLARRTLRWRVGVPWYVLAIFFVPVTAVLAATALVGTAPLEALGDKSSLLFTLVLPYLLFALFSNLAEEIGWTGFLFDRLQDRYAPLKASLIVWVPWALFHLPGFYEETGSSLGALYVLGLFAIPQLCSRVLVAWLYNNTNRSVLLVGLFHAAFNTTTGPVTREFIPATAEDQFLVQVGGLIVAAVLVAVITRGRLSYRPAAGREEQPGPSPRG